MQVSPVYQLLLLGQKYSELQRALKKRSRRPLFDLPVSAWLRADDRGVPQEFVRQSVRSLLDVNFETLAATPGIGAIKLRKLLELLERVLESGGGSQSRSAASAEPRVVPCAPSENSGEAAQWDSDVRAITQAGLDDFLLGRMIASLSELPRRLWHAPLRQFTQLSYGRLHEIPYLGARRVSSILRLVTDTARLARTLTHERKSTISWLSRHVAEADGWIKHRLRLSERPPSESVCAGLLRPLLGQIEIDLGPRAVAVACHVLSQTYVELPIEFPLSDVDVSGFSKPRIHQIKELIREAVELRWPSGEQLLPALIDHSLRFGGRHGSVQLLCEMATLFFGIRNTTRLPILAADQSLTTSWSGS